MSRSIMTTEYDSWWEMAIILIDRVVLKHAKSSEVLKCGNKF